MANLPETPEWVAGIYQLEESDPVQAGPGGIDNMQATQLAKRTAYLKKKQEDDHAAQGLIISSLSQTVASNKTLTDQQLAILRGTGQISFFPGSGAPEGWLKANGATLSRSAYPELWAFAQSRLAPGNDTYNYPGLFGAGDGSTTFKLPDVRELFPRFWSDGGGHSNEWGRQAGSRQNDEIKSHNHVSYPYNKASAKASDTYQDNETTGGADGNNQEREYKIANMSTTDWSDATISAYGGVETRPRNVALLGCIKY